MKSKSVKSNASKVKPLKKSSTHPISFQLPIAGSRRNSKNSAKPTRTVQSLIRSRLSIDCVQFWKLQQMFNYERILLFNKRNEKQEEFLNCRKKEQHWNIIIATYLLSLLYINKLLFSFFFCFTFLPFWFSSCC